MTRRFLAFLTLTLFAASAHAAEPLPGEACTAANNLQFTSGPEVAGGGGHAMLCQGGTWKSILSFNSAAGLTKLGNQTCATNEILKFNGTTWACAADGGTLPGLASASIWVGNAGGAATAVAISGDATLSNTGVLTLGANSVTTSEITDSTVASADIAADTIAAIDIATGGVATAEILDGTILSTDLADDAVTIPKLAATGTASATTYLRGDNTWATVSTGLPALTSANIWVGNGTNVATAVTMSGDATMTNAGVLTLGTGVVTTTEILDSTIASADIAADTIAAADIATGGVATAEILDGTIGAADIATDAVTASEIAANAVTASELATDAVTNAKVAADAIGIAELSATGTPGATTFLRGDNTWAAPSGGGGVTARTSVTCTDTATGIGSNASCIATCTAGYFVSGCGAWFGTNWVTHEPDPVSTRPSGNGCECMGKTGRINCTAYCVQ
jgi:hypothetical protein